MLVTGGTGVLGAMVARHLVTAHGARRLLLVSRAGDRAEGVAALRDEPTALGAQVSFAGCDVADRDALAGVLRAVPADWPLRAVVHTAGVTDDGVLTALTAEQVDAVLRPKVDAAWHLHQLTLDLGLSAFVLYSSLAGWWGPPVRRTTRPATPSSTRSPPTGGPPGCRRSPWPGGCGSSRADSPGGWRRRTCAGWPARAAPRSPAPPDWPCSTRPCPVTRPSTPPPHWTSDSCGAAPEPPVLLRGLVPAGRPSARASASPGRDLGTQLAALSATERDRMVADLVRTRLAAVLGHADTRGWRPSARYRNWGFDSLTAVELRNQLGRRHRAALPTTLAFDYPTAGALTALPARPASPTPPPPAPDRHRPPHPTDEPIAIIGMGCRFPGGVSTPTNSGTSSPTAPTPSPNSPPTAAGTSTPSTTPTPTHPGTTYTRDGGFLHDADHFDAAFFGISPARSPRHRPPATPPPRNLLGNPRTRRHQPRHPPRHPHRRLRRHHVQATTAPAWSRAPTSYEGYLGTGSAASVASGRIAYTFGLQGPAITIDTACSSSLVAIHLAARPSATTNAPSPSPAASPSWPPPHLHRVRPPTRTRPRRPLQALLRRTPTAPAGPKAPACSSSSASPTPNNNGHPVLAIIRGSAVNQDGAPRPHRTQRPRPRTRHPPGPRQRPASPRTTSTPSKPTAPAPRLGDPIEAQALLATYGQHRTPTARSGSAPSSPTSATPRPPPASPASSRWSSPCSTASCPRPSTPTQPTPHIDWSTGNVDLLTETPALAAHRPPPPRRRHQLRHQRHQRPRHPRTTPHPTHPTTTHHRPRTPPAPHPLRPPPSGPRPTGRPTPPTPDRPPPPRPHRRGVLADPAGGAAGAGRGRGRGPGGTAGRPALGVGHGRPDGGPDGLPVHRPGRAAGGDGPRATDHLPGVPRRLRRGVRGPGPAAVPTVAGRRRLRRRPGRHRIHPTGAVRVRGGPVPAAVLVGHHPGLRGRALHRRTVGRARRRRAVPGRRRHAGRRAGPPDAGPPRRWGDAGGRRDRGGGRRGGATARHRGGERPPIAGAGRPRGRRRRGGGAVVAAGSPGTTAGRVTRVPLLTDDADAPRVRRDG